MRYINLLLTLTLTFIILYHASRQQDSTYSTNMHSKKHKTHSLGLGYKLCAVIPVAGQRYQILLLALRTVRFRSASGVQVHLLVSVAAQSCPWVHFV